MRRFLAVAVGGLGLGALLRRRLRRPALEPATSRADELREKLAESRAAEDRTADATASEGDVANRRRDVHERARSSIDELS